MLSVRPARGDVVATVKECRDLAADCLRWAEAADHPASREVFLAMAEKWASVALELEAGSDNARVALKLEAETDDADVALKLQAESESNVHEEAEPASSDSTELNEPE
jgi:hypothetical protein